ncbi:MAG: hypothetical protein JXB23_16720 [Candidatus Aminicenantes bacterium]|nr:hypothetical protein [Candidatus Aminicenantes bacterium]
MSAKKISSFIFLFLLFAALTFPQSLAEAAKKEKERRASLKGRKTVVVTNADLKKIIRRSAVSVVQSTSSDESTPARIQPPSNPPRRIETPVETRMDTRDSMDPTFQGDRLVSPEETVEMLTNKMYYLQQKFYTFTDWTLREEIQKEMVQTYEKLQKAQADAEKSGVKKRKRKAREKN